jgi:hypothetical protein
MPSTQLNRSRLKALVHYAISRCPGEELGRTKLHKCAYFADMLHWLNSHQPLTGETYVKQNHGPFAAHMSDVVRELVREGAITEVAGNFYGLRKYQYDSLRQPDLGMFTEAERALLDEVIDFVCRKNTARSISELSHGAAWEAAEKGQEIPYFTAIMMVPSQAEQADREWADAEVKTIANTPPSLRPVQRVGALRSRLQPA